MQFYRCKHACHRFIQFGSEFRAINSAIYTRKNMTRITEDARTSSSRVNGTKNVFQTKLLVATELRRSL